METGSSGSLDPAFYDRAVLTVARDLLGCLVSHGDASGVIVETEAYHQSEPACHAFVGLTARTWPLFGPPGRAYVYRSYGIHALLNAVCEPEGVGAAVLIRALEPFGGLESMRARRRVSAPRDLCSGPGKLSSALGVGLEHNDGDLATGPVRILPPPSGFESLQWVASPRVGISKAVELPWRFSSVGFASVSKPWPPALRERIGRARD
ncbi:MAG: DNA-3-methyladenine glycosylase [Actinomycetota bacterium]|nr:DNA-3-methyladenine glycosylase [Actinomycetota bacterium]